MWLKIITLTIFFPQVFGGMPYVMGVFNLRVLAFCHKINNKLCKAVIQLIVMLVQRYVT